jgi:hypothetical protein
VGGAQLLYYRLVSILDWVWVSTVFRGLFKVLLGFER